MKSPVHDTNWFLAQLKPNCANIADRNLQRQGFKTFLPLEKITQTCGGKFVSMKRPLFPGYIFVAFNMEHGHWHAVNSTYGITRLVSFGDKPREVPHELMDQLRARCVDGVLSKESTPFRLGDSVTLSNGPFVDFVATVEQMATNQRVWILIDFLGGKTRMAVGHGDIKAQ
jgi:transcriptional antiterminator RfaH